LTGRQVELVAIARSLRGHVPQSGL
jgi:hypothetical protein